MDGLGPLIIVAFIIWAALGCPMPWDGRHD